MVSPYDSDLINDGSEVRRKYIDSLISQFDRIYLDDLINYNKALTQRNVLLKSFAEKKNYDEHSIELWNAHLCKYGENIHQKRKSFLEEFLPLFQEYFTYISGGKEKVFIEYVSQLNKNNLSELFVTNLQRDRMLQYTTSGIHKDDLELKISDYPIKKFGSQGQQKSFVVAMKLAQFEFTRNLKSFKPILLLDDIFDKLDNSRVEQLIKLTGSEKFGQVFITDTQPDRIAKIFQNAEIPHKIFTIISGTANEIK